MPTELQPSVADRNDLDPPPAHAASSRRAILAASLGSLAGFVASAIGRPGLARAANGDAVVLGSTSNAASGTTKITTSGSSQAFFVVGSTGPAVHGSATSGTGVLAESGDYYGLVGQGDLGGVWGTTSTGVGVTGVTNSGTGVHGITGDPGGPGVLGQSYGDGTGVFGFSSDQNGVVPPSQGLTGVYGYQGGPGVGVWGTSGGSTGTGMGVRGESNSSDGVGVAGFGYNGGTGLEGSGRVGAFATSNTNGWMGIWGRHFGAGYGVAGDSVSLIGVSGTSNATDHPGVLARSQGNSTGLLGYSGAEGDTLPIARAKTGVFGQATQDATSRGVVGVAAAGDGVRGEATSGAALRGTASSKAGYAVRGSGRVRFEKVSGVATIAANATSVKVTPGTDVTTGSFVLLTAQSNIGSRSLYYTVDAVGDTITIHISSSRTSSTLVAWLLLN